MGCLLALDSPMLQKASSWLVVVIVGMFVAVAVAVAIVLVEVEVVVDGALCSTHS